VRDYILSYNTLVILALSPKVPKIGPIVTKISKKKIAFRHPSPDNPANYPHKPEDGYGDVPIFDGEK